MLPVVARTFARIQERLLGRRTFAILKELEESQWWPRERIAALQLERLQRLVASAYAHSSYWRQLMDERGIKPGDIRSLADLKRFPLIEKSTLRDQRENMVWRQEGRRVLLARTSGSTNDALEFYTSSNREACITAARMRGHRWVGINPGDKELYFWASPVELNTQGRLKQIRDMLVNNPLTSTLALSPAVIPEFLKLWLRWRPKCIFTYGSSAALFARMARSMHVDLTPLREAGLRTVITTAEMLSDVDRGRISEAFGVPVHDSYGLREGGLIGHECDRFTMHTNDEHLILETIDPHARMPTDGTGELVITNLSSFVQPVIRYRTNDIVTLSQERCPCGRTLNHLRVTGGRLHDFVVTRDGRWISCVNFLYICKSVPGILELQVRQERLGEVHLLVVPEADRSAGLADRIMAEARARLGPGEEITVQFVDRIEPTKSGKYRVVVSTVATQMLADNKYTL